MVNLLTSACEVPLVPGRGRGRCVDRGRRRYVRGSRGWGAAGELGQSGQAVVRLGRQGEAVLELLLGIRLDVVSEDPGRGRLQEAAADHEHHHQGHSLD
jgi:hypothetical protein